MPSPVLISPEFVDRGQQLLTEKEAAEFLRVSVKTQGAFLSVQRPFPFSSIVSMIGLARQSFPHVRPLISSGILFHSDSLANNRLVSCGYANYGIR
jgi:hypothetical protein